MSELSFKVRSCRILIPALVFKPSPFFDLTSVAVTALVDTGATVSGIGPKAIRMLDLSSYGKKRLKSATDEVFSAYYLFRVGLLNDEQRNEPQTLSSALPYVFDDVNGFSFAGSNDFDVILGMDILSRCDLNVSRLGSGRLAFG